MTTRRGPWWTEGSHGRPSPGSSAPGLRRRATGGRDAGARGPDLAARPDQGAGRAERVVQAGGTVHGTAHVVRPRPGAVRGVRPPVPRGAHRAGPGRGPGAPA